MHLCCRVSNVYDVETDVLYMYEEILPLRNTFRITYFRKVKLKFGCKIEYPNFYRSKVDRKLVSL